MDPDGGEPIKFFKDYTNKPKKDLETAKKECADACGTDNDCKYAMILWIPNESHWCAFWTKEACEMTDNPYNDSYIYTKQ